MNLAALGSVNAAAAVASPSKMTETRTTLQGNGASTNGNNWTAAGSKWTAAGSKWTAAGRKLA